MSDIILVGEQLPADQNPVNAYLGRIAKSSRRTQLNALKNIVAMFPDTDGLMPQEFPWQNLRYQHTQAIRTTLMDNPDYEISTVNRHLSALRGVLKEAWRLGLMNGEDYQRAIDIENIKQDTILHGRMLQPEEIQALLQVCLAQQSESGIRDAAIISLLYVTGMRRIECVNLNMADFDMNTGQVKILGKRNIARTSYVNGNARNHLINWFHLRGFKPGAMFLSIDNNGHINDTRMNDQALYDMLVRRGKQAGLENFSPHDLRRSAISEMLLRSVDIATVAKIVGHKSLDTTRRYDLRDEIAKQAASKVLDVPI